MYSYEDRIRAVKLYIKFGKRTGPTIRQLGYPTKNSLRAGIGNTNRIVVCERAMRAQGRNTLSSRCKQQCNIILAMIVALPQP